MKRFVVLICALTMGILGANTVFANEFVRTNPEGVGIDGYSPVSYFDNQKAEKGSAEFAAEFEGVTYWLTDYSQMMKFTYNPKKYLPAHGGWCSLMLSGSGQRTPANPESWTMVDGELLLFWSGTFKDMEINGLSNWESKTEGSEKKASKRMKDANKTWEGILEGKKKGQIVLFNTGDGERISEDQLKKAKRNF
jgi:YHS domain-containing protein